MYLYLKRLCFPWNPKRNLVIALSNPGFQPFLLYRLSQFLTFALIFNLLKPAVQAQIKLFSFLAQGQVVQG